MHCSGPFVALNAIAFVNDDVVHEVSTSVHYSEYMEVEVRDCDAQTPHSAPVHRCLRGQT